MITILAQEPIIQPEVVTPACSLNSLWLTNLTADFPVVGGDGTISATAIQYGYDAFGNVKLAEQIPATNVRIDNFLAHSSGNPALEMGLLAVLVGVACQIGVTTDAPALTTEQQNQAMAIIAGSGNAGAIAVINAILSPFVS